MLPNFDYVRPATLDEAVARAAAPGARLHAGGTDLLGCLRDGVFTATTVVSLGGLTGLAGIARKADGGLRIGALTRVAEVAAHPLVREGYRALAQAAAAVASPQLRNQGTLGGNLCQKPRCWYYRGDFHCLRKGGDTCYAWQGENENHCLFGGDGCYVVHPSDTAPALVALDALVRVRGAGGERLLPVAELHVAPAVDPQRETVLEPGEVLTEVVVPAPRPGARSAYRKVRSRQAWDFAVAGVALQVVMGRGGDIEDARVVLSGAAPVPWRLTEVERYLVGRRIDAAVAAEAGSRAVAGAEPLAANGYKVPLFAALVAAELTALAG